MMATAKYVDIAFVNKTEHKDCSVVVFMQNESANADRLPLVAWHVFKTQRPARFRFPWTVAVGAEWKEKDQTNIVGPCNATLGTTWNFQAPHTLEQAAQLGSNQSGDIIVNNSSPHKCQLGLYKDFLLVMKKDAGAGDKAIFQIKPKLCFGLAKGIKEGSTFLLRDLLYQSITVDLDKFSTDFKVIVSNTPLGNQLQFKVEQF